MDYSEKYLSKSACSHCVYLHRWSMTHGPELATDDPPAKDSNALLIKDYPVTGDHIDLREFYFSNQEYYRKIEQLKKAHLQTMAELELMYRKKLDLKGVSAADNTDRTNLSPQGRSPVITSNLKKARSALELRWTSDLSDLSDEECNTEKGLLISPKELIKSMWQEFSVNKLSPHQWHPFSSSLQSLPADCQAASKPKGRIRGQRLKKRKQNVGEGWHPRVTVPKPFHMTLREAERRKKGIKSRLEIEQENADLRRQVEELTECQRKFHASPVPAHVRLLLYEELQEHRRLHREMEQQRLHTLQRPFSFLERERLKKEQKEAKLREQMLKHNREEEEWRKCPFKAKPVPRVVKEAASGEQQKDEELYRAIKMQMRARELLHSASMPPSMLARHLSEKQVQKAAQDDEHTHRPKINAELPDFNASYRTFRKQLAKHREVRPVAACEPFQLRTANISSHKERIMADIEAEIKSPKPSRWPFMTPPALSPRTPLSSLCSSLSGSQECLSAKITDAAKKRQEAMRKVLEQRKRAEEEEEKWKEKQKQREKRLQKVVTKRAQENDLHVALAQTCQSKLKDFRKQDLQRQREYQEEMREIQERVKGRPLLLEQVAQMNAKRAAEKLYSATLHGCGLSESFISSKAPKDLKHRHTPSPAHSGSQTPPTYSKNRNEDHEEFPDLQDSLLDDYADDYEEYDHDMEAGHMDRDEDDRHNECHDTDEEKANGEGHSFHDELNFDDDDDDDDEQDDRYKNDDLSSKHSQSSRGSKSNNSHHSDRSRTGSVN
ncbi:protein FAM161A-like isoform X2 [Sinocyclocheilus anshuiensis]|uniref:protein FAM161A-like isoform X2 n=1 Tax=Sinocyclocheilus anshuiensis TaxID=1608454 RepID=UPI0007BA41BB|nr:PREDICTED: protein FAM161A-like isoform X2 [Sinocyclocheilus anshuiensis]